MNKKSEIEEELYIKIKNYIKEQRNVSNLVFLCIGTDRMTGDALGPLVGSKLKEKLARYPNIDIYGTLDNNLSCSNINETMDLVKNKYLKPCVIAIDSALSKKENIGKIIVSNQSTQIGRGLNKKKIEIGDISIKGVVGYDSKLPTYNFYTLQNVSLNEVINMANIVTKAILSAINVY